MSPDQAPEALTEGSKRNSGYQTVSKFYNLIVESSGSTRRIQRAQDRENPTSVGQDIIHRTIHDQGVQYRPSDPRLKESKETQDRSCTLAPPRPPPDHQQKALHFAGPPPDHQPKALYSAGPPPDHQQKALHFAGPPPDHQPKALYSAGPPPDHQQKALYFAGPPPDHQSKALHFAEVQPKALHPAQGPKSSLRPYAPLKA
ncbi:hypothetical protein M5K25_022657 [Dendrobium thyrsiflorum]|uniref:Uncharacterized protein n=1 Tax=Dendrobium thyrsiflorum TaxID=117978 RepID=A0ABD0U733_DENTH